jgi:hypothetical protein
METINSTTSIRVPWNKGICIPANTPELLIPGFNYWGWTQRATADRNRSSSRPIVGRIDGMCADGQLRNAISEVQVKKRRSWKFSQGGGALFCLLLLAPFIVGLMRRWPTSSATQWWAWPLFRIAPIFRGSRLVNLVATLDPATPLDNPAHLVRGVFWHRYSLHLLRTVYVRDRIYAVKI